MAFVGSLLFAFHSSGVTLGCAVPTGAGGGLCDPVSTTGSPATNIHASSSSLLPLILKKKDTLLNRGASFPSPLCSRWSGLLLPHPVLPLGREAEPVCRAVSWGAGFSPECSHPPLRLVLFCFSSGFQCYPALPRPRGPGRRCLHLLHYPGPPLRPCAIHVSQAVTPARVASPTPGFRNVGQRGVSGRARVGMEDKA